MQFSPDREWIWDGAQWRPVYSPDRRWRWDGRAWVPAGPGPDPGPLLVTRIAASGADAVAALSAVCTHLGCTVLPQACATCASGTILQCPCHGSQFGLTGNLVSGPASGNLIRYVSSFDGTNVTVSTQPRGA